MNDVGGWKVFFFSQRLLFNTKNTFFNNLETRDVIHRQLE